MSISMLQWKNSNITPQQASVCQRFRPHSAREHMRKTFMRLLVKLGNPHRGGYGHSIAGLTRYIQLPYHFPVYLRIRKILI